MLISIFMNQASAISALLFEHIHATQTIKISVLQIKCVKKRLEIFHKMKTKTEKSVYDAKGGTAIHPQ
jgi:hypothetical protein